MIESLLGSIPLMIMLTGALVGIASSLVGTFLVLRGNSLLSDAISHSILFGIVVVWMLVQETSGPLQMLGAVLTGLLTVFLTEMLTNTRLVKQDAAIGLVFPMLFSIGVLLLNIYARDVHIDQHTVLLGEIGFVWLDTVTLAGYAVPSSLVWLSLATLANLAFVLLFYKELKLAIFDRALARAFGLAPGLLFYGLLLLTSTTAVAAFDAVGVVLLIAFVIVPPSTAYLLTDRLDRMLIYGALVSIGASVSGYYAAVALNVSIGAMMAVMTGVALLLAFLCGPRYGVFARWLRGRRQRDSHNVRTLVVHLFNHENEADAQEEQVVSALFEHLCWPTSKARKVLAASLDAGVVLRQGQRLYLTPGAVRWPAKSSNPGRVRRLASGKAFSPS